MVKYEWLIGSQEERPSDDGEDTIFQTAIYPEGDMSAGIRYIYFGVRRLMDTCATDLPEGFTIGDAVNHEMQKVDAGELSLITVVRI